MILGCPIDLRPLARVDTTWQCEAGHSYDVAREGYVNLLPPGQTEPEEGGRRQGLDQRPTPVSQCRLLRPARARNRRRGVRWHAPATVLDVGCGEGYYTSHLRGSEVVGIDISAPGIKIAARSYPSASFAVGNALGLPVVDGSCDAVVSVFAPVDPAQFARVISSDGVAVVAIPGANHLDAVRGLLYETPRPHDEALPLQFDPRFALADVDRVSSAITLPDQQVLRDLLTMTPYRFAVPPDVIARAVEADTPLTTTIEFLVGVFRPL